MDYLKKCMIFQKFKICLLHYLRRNIDLKILLDEVDKIKDIDDFDDEKMFSPTDNTFDLERKNISVTNENVLLNVPKKMGNFVEAPVMINE